MTYTNQMMTLVLCLCCASYAFADTAMGTHIDAVGKVLSIDQNGVFEIEGQEKSFRLFGLELTESFPRDEFVGQKISCLSVYSLEHTRGRGYSETIIPSECYFSGSLLRGSVKEILLDIYAAREICDEEFDYILGCKHEEEIK